MGKKSGTKALLAALLLLLGACAALLALDYSMSRKLARVHPDQSLAELINTAGQPSVRLRCEDPPKPLRRSDSAARAAELGGAPRYCKVKLLYRSVLTGSTWLILIDDQDTLMQIERNALP
jgi:hypothetical protein